MIGLLVVLPVNKIEFEVLHQSASLKTTNWDRFNVDKLLYVKHPVGNLVFVKEQSYLANIRSHEVLEKELEDF